jgi:hypothetical protein
LVVLPGRAFAVLDGVSDRVGTRYEGMLAGRYASQLLQRTLEQWLGGADAALDDPWAAVQACVAAIRATYDRLGITETVRGDWSQQMASTLALVTLSGDDAHVALVGDTGLRVNGEIVMHEQKDLDFITAALRQRAWAPIAAAVGDPGTRERLSRQLTWAGTRHVPDAVREILTQDALDAIEQQTMAFCAGYLPHVPEVDMRRMVQGGIINGQGGYQNSSTSILGYPSLNGFDIPRAMIRIETLPRRDLHSIELFSDGYFAFGDGFGVAAWERKFAEVEAADPHKVLLYPSPKGSVDGQWADDRTYLGVRFP